MKKHLLQLSLAACLGLPATALAQGTYLSDPTDNSNHALVVAPGGNVGIGTTEPTSILHVKTMGDYAGVFEQSIPAANAWIKIANNRRAYLMGVRGDTRDGFVIYDTAAGDRIYLDPNGNVGIGTEAPSSKLHVITTGGGVCWRI